RQTRQRASPAARSARAQVTQALESAPQDPRNVVPTFGPNYAKGRDSTPRIAEVRLDGASHSSRLRWCHRPCDAPQRNYCTPSVGRLSPAPERMRKLAEMRARVTYVVIPRSRLRCRLEPWRKRA